MNRASLNFPQFENLMKEICFTSFLSASPGDRNKLFFKYINEPSQLIYKISFHIGSRRRESGSDFGTKGTEEVNSSIDLDFTIKEALETLKTKDESFRSSHSAFSREVSPVPSIKSRQDHKSSDLRSVGSTSSINRRPYLNKSVPDSPNTSLLAARPSSRYMTSQNCKDDELNEFLKTEQLVENEVKTVKVNLHQNSGIKSMANLHQKKNSIQLRKNISIKKIEYSKNKQEFNPSNSQINFSKGATENNGKKTIVIKLGDKETLARKVISPRNNNNLFTKKVHGNLYDKNPPLFEVENAVNGLKKRHTEIIQNIKVRKIKDNIIEKHREYIFKDRDRLFSNNFVKMLIFSSWKMEWQKSKSLKS